MKKNRRNKVLFLLYMSLVVITLVLVFKLGASPKKAVETIGFITTGDLSETGWTAIHYQGLKAACDKLGVELFSFWEIAEFDGSCPEVVKLLADEGVRMIILNGSEYAEEMKDLLKDYPDISFYASEADYHAPNLTTYSSRLYQARYLSGIVAGMQTQSGKIGFVAAEQEVSVYRGINAFTLGIRRVNPEAEVVVAWTGSWKDREKEMELAEALIEKEGVDVITYYQNQPYVIDAAEASAVASIGYYEPVEHPSDRYLTCAMCDWEPLYEDLIQEHLRGQSNRTASKWLGLESGVIRLTEFSPLVSQEARDEVERAKQQILSGQDVFTGVIYDNQGNEHCASGEAMSDDTLQHRMDWLVEGVRVYEN